MTRANEMDQNFNFFLPLSKIDKENRTVSGYASTTCVDSEGEIVTQDALKTAWPEYWKWGNIREMHRPSAVGTAKEFSFDTKGLYLTAKIVDNDAWNKCVEGVYKGFSIGGQKLARMGKTITKVGLHEISICDRPSNPECSFTVAKAAGAEGSAYLLPENADDLSSGPPEKEPDNDYDDGAEVRSIVAGESNGTDSRQKKATKKIAKLQKKLEKAFKQREQEQAIIQKAAESNPNTEYKFKNAKKFAKSQKESASSSSVAHIVDGGAEAVLSKVECRHEFGLGEKLAKAYSPEEDIPDTDKFVLSKRFRGKEKVMSDAKFDTNDIAKAVIQHILGDSNPTLSLVKAAEDEMKDVKGKRKEAEDCVKALFNMHKQGLAKSEKGPAFDHTAALQNLTKIYDNLRSIKTVTKSIRGNLAKAAGRISGEGTVENGKPGVYQVPQGITTISPGEMDNLPAAKAAGMVSTEHAETLAKLAAAEAERDLLKSMPAGPIHGQRPYLFDMKKFAGDTAKDDKSKVLLKDVNPSDLGSDDQSTRENAVAKVIGNGILGGAGKDMFDPSFRGSAGITVQ